MKQYPAQARGGVLGAVASYLLARDNTCRNLRAYETAFRDLEKWNAVVVGIAKAIGRESSSVLRMIAEFEQENGLDSVFPEVPSETAPAPAVPNDETVIAAPAHAPAPHLAQSCRLQSTISGRCLSRGGTQHVSLGKGECKESDSMEFRPDDCVVVQETAEACTKGRRKEEEG